MIQSVSLEQHFNERLLNLSSFRYGLILSGPIGDEECIFLCIEAPKDPEESHNRSISTPQCILDLDARWIASHAKNLRRMIPGGLRISGLCVVAKHSDLMDNQKHLKKILDHISREDCPLSTLVDKENGDMLVLGADTISKRLTCIALNVERAETIFRAVSIKLRPVFIRWRAFKTHISICSETTLPSDRKKENILHELQAGVEPYLRSLVTETRLLVNGELHGDEEQLFLDDSSKVQLKENAAAKNSKRSKKSRRGGSEGGDVITPNTLREMEANRGAWVSAELTLFGPQFPRWQRASSSSSLDSGTSSDTNTTATGGTAADPLTYNELLPVNRLIVNGRIPGIAFLPATATVGELLQALRRDLIHSVLARLQLLTEELHITSGQLEVPRMFLPQRVLVSLPACPSLPLSDYRFLSETTDDVVARLRYFCVPMTAAATGHSVGRAGEGYITGLANLSFSPASSRSTSNEDLNAPSTWPEKDQIDASCLDTSLEKSPEGSADEFSEPELLDDGMGLVQPASSYSSRPVLMGIGCLIVLLAILMAYANYGRVFSG